MLPLVKSSKLFKLFTVLPLKPDDKIPPLTPNDVFTWANEADEIIKEMNSKILFFIIVGEADFKAVLYYEK